MHHRLLVTTRNAASSKDARRTVHDYLVEEGFVGKPGARWSRGVADWFVIGGRFSGDLAECGAKWLLKRFHYASFGADDDAQLVTPELYDRFLEQYEGSEDDEGFADLERERLSRKFIGTKWLVVVDYHT